jgi:hypothetical protein
MDGPTVDARPCRIDWDFASGKRGVDELVAQPKEGVGADRRGLLVAGE